MATTQIRGNTQIIGGTILDAQISTSAAIASIKLADGTNFLKKDGSVAMAAAFNAGSFVINNIASPVASTDAANKAYVDSVAQGLSAKGSCRALSTTNITLSGLQTVDGVVLAANDRILVGGQTTGASNGIYSVASGAWARAADASASADVVEGMYAFIEEGTANGKTGWILTTANPITLGTTALTFSEFAAAASYSAGNGITIAGTVISAALTPSGGLTFTGATVGVVLADSTLSVGSGGLKLSSLTNANILVGNGSNVATGVAVTGDVTITNAGVATVNNTSGTGFTKYGDLIIRETPTGSVNGSNTTFTLVNTPVAGSEQVFLNGILQEPGAGNDYTISGVTITYLTAPVTGDRLRVTYQK